MDQKEGFWDRASNIFVMKRVLVCCLVALICGIVPAAQAAPTPASVFQNADRFVIGWAGTDVARYKPAAYAVSPTETRVVATKYSRLPIPGSIVSPAVTQIDDQVIDSSLLTEANDDHLRTSLQFRIELANTGVWDIQIPPDYLWSFSVGEFPDYEVSFAEGTFGRGFQGSIDGYPITSTQNTYTAWGHGATGYFAFPWG